MAARLVNWILGFANCLLDFSNDLENVFSNA
jgi:hypothetical protein